MNKIIIVNYISVGDMDPDDVMDRMNEIAEIVDQEEGIINYVIPTRGETRIECINPKIVSEEDFNQAKRVLDETQRRVNEFLNS